MKKVLILLCVAALMPGVASAEIMGSWSSNVSGSYTIFTLTVTPTAGESMYGFDIKVKNSNLSITSAFSYTSGMVFLDEVDTKTHFLLNPSHEDEFGEPVDDLVVASQGVSSSYLLGGFSVSAGGAYEDGWSGALQLLQISSLTTKGLQVSDLLVTETQGQSAALAAISESGDKVPIMFIPEPGTLMLLVCSLMGLFVYARCKCR